MLALLTEHRVATADQLARVEFPNAARARGRLNLLARSGVVARWRPYQRPGSAPYHYTVGPVGAAITAAREESPAPRPSDIAEKVLRLQHSPKLGHMLGVVEFFTLLHAAARATPGARLVEWWSEETTAAECLGYVRPDGYGHWRDTSHADASLRFLFEHDRGTESLTTVVAKLDKYARLMTEHPIALPVLIELPDRMREANLHQRMHHHKRPAERRHIVVATTNTDYLQIEGHNPAGPVWWLAETQPVRRRLIDLAKR